MRDHCPACNKTVNAYALDVDIGIATLYNYYCEDCSSFICARVEPKVKTRRRKKKSKE